jgi:hypothetical protein
MAAKKTAKKATRRARNDGGLYEKHTTRLDKRTGKTVAYSYWQASRDVSEENLPPGAARKRITGTGPTPAVAKARLEKNWLDYHNPTSTKPSRRRGTPARTVAHLFDEWYVTLQAQRRVRRCAVSRRSAGHRSCTHI